MAKSKAFRAREKYIVEQQIAGATYGAAQEKWQASEEIADGFFHDGVRTTADVSEGEIRASIANWIALREAGL